MNLKALQRPNPLSDRADLEDLSRKSGLSSAEKTIVSQMISTPESDWSEGDRRCLTAMKQRHLQP